MSGPGFVHRDIVMLNQFQVKKALNTTAYKDVLYNCVLPTLWQSFRPGPHRGVMVRSGVHILLAEKDFLRKLISVVTLHRKFF